IVFDVPSIGDLSLISSSTDGNDDQKAVLLFSDPLDPSQDLTGLVGITGSEDVRVAIDGNRLVIYPQQRLSGDQQAFVPASLRNTAGRSLGADLTVDLLFEDLKPAVRLIGKGVILPASDGLVLPFEAVNLSAVEVRVIRIHERNVSRFLQLNQLGGERELARVGRLIARKTVPLRTADNPDPGRWNRYFLDLKDHFNAEPGAIYRVELAFDRRHSTYPCEGSDRTTEPVANELTWEEEQAAYDRVNDHWYYDDYGYYYEDYDHREREDPCTDSYYMHRERVSRNLLASDLGLIAKRGNDGSMVVAVSDLRTTDPMAGVKLQVLDLQRKVMAETVSDREGLVTLPPTANKPFLLVASKGSQ